VFVRFRVIRRNQVARNLHVRQIRDHVDLVFQLLLSLNHKVRHVLETEVVRDQGVEIPRQRRQQTLIFLLKCLFDLFEHGVPLLQGLG
jgi:hypothetical protein